MDRDGLMESVGMESLLGWGRDGVLGWRWVENEDGLGGRGLEDWILILNWGWMGAQLTGLVQRSCCVCVCLRGTAASGARAADHLPSWSAAAWPNSASCCGTSGSFAECVAVGEPCGCTGPWGGLLTTCRVASIYYGRLSDAPDPMWPSVCRLVGT